MLERLFSCLVASSFNLVHILKHITNPHLISRGENDKKRGRQGGGRGRCGPVSISPCRFLAAVFCSCTHSWNDCQIWDQKGVFPYWPDCQGLVFPPLSCRVGSAGLPRILCATQVHRHPHISSDSYSFWSLWRSSGGCLQVFWVFLARGGALWTLLQ